MLPLPPPHTPHAHNTIIDLQPYNQDSTVTFAKAYGDHMVLQSAPKRAQVWGWYTPATVAAASAHDANNNIRAETRPPKRDSVRIVLIDAAGTNVFVGGTWIGADGLWVATLPPINASLAAYTVTVAEAHGRSNTAVLHNVLFGELWVCGGQSNMEYNVGGFPSSPGSQDNVTNATAEIAAAANFPHIRVMTVGQLYESSVAMDDLGWVEQPWAVASPDAVGAGWLGPFSAVCWFFGRDLFQALGSKIPIGLVSSNWGGTKVEAWTPTEALAPCLGKSGGGSSGKLSSTSTIDSTLFPSEREGGSSALHHFLPPNATEHCKFPLRMGINTVGSSCQTGQDCCSGKCSPTDAAKSAAGTCYQPAGGTTPASLFNSMIAPLTRMTIAGAVWYQGESNANQGAEIYNCTFPAMIEAWRQTWHKNTGSQTDVLFPFGFVQISSWGNAINDPPTTGVDPGVTMVRWAQRQTNDKVAKTFMATAIDLAAFEGGCGRDSWPASLCIHPGYKQPVGARLVRGALSTAYGWSNTSGAGYSSGPTFKGATFLETAKSVVVAFQTLGAGSTITLYDTGDHSEFDLSYDHGVTWKYNVVVSPQDPGVPCSTGAGACVQLASGASDMAPTHVRYLWSNAPCTHPHENSGRCAVYSSVENLPVTPFMGAVVHARPPAPAPSPPPPPPQPPADIATAVYLTDYPEAKCLDGSPYAYYIRKAAPGTVNSTKWVFHMQGGGWCSSGASCYGRTDNYLGTSKTSVTGYTNVSDFNATGCDNRGCGILMLNDKTHNEYTYDWNAVQLRYCDGMAFSSNASEPYLVTDGGKGNGTLIWLRGLVNLQSTFAHLIAKNGLGDSTYVISNGASAGGHATYLHADRITDWVHDANAAAGKPAASVVSLPDSGFWPADPNERFYKMFTGWFQMLGNDTSGLAKNCKWRGTNATKCLFPQYFADEIETRLFPLQSLYDPLQAKMSKIDPNEHGKWLLDTINATVVQTKRADGKPNGGYLYSCSRHCGGELVKIDGYTAPTALETFMGIAAPGEGVHRPLFLQYKPDPCIDCCNDGAYHPHIDHE